MSKQTTENWINKTGHGASVRKNAAAPVISKGATIMEMADRLWPHLSEMLRGVRDNNGMLLQPAHIRGIALNVAQDLMKKYEAKQAS